MQRKIRDTNCHNLWNYCLYTSKYRGAAHKYKFIIKELAEGFQEQFNCLGKKQNRERQNFFSADWKRNFTKLLKYL